MLKHEKYTWADTGDTEETWTCLDMEPDHCTICGEPSKYVTVQSSFMPGAQFLVVGIDLCSDCREELYRAMDTWVETDNYATRCLLWVANGCNEGKMTGQPMVELGLEVRRDIRALRKRILDWVMEQRVEIE